MACLYTCFLSAVQLLRRCICFQTLHWIIVWHWKQWLNWTCIAKPLSLKFPSSNLIFPRWMAHQWNIFCPDFNVKYQVNRSKVTSFIGYLLMLHPCKYQLHCERIDRTLVPPPRLEKFFNFDLTDDEKMFDEGDCNKPEPQPYLCSRESNHCNCFEFISVTHTNS